MENNITKLFGIKYPIIQAPMAGGVTTTELVAAVSNNGGLGFIGAGYMSPNQLRDQIREIRKLTANNFGVNLFVPNQFAASEDEINFAIRKLKPVLEKLKVNEADSPRIPDPLESFEIFYGQVNVLIEEKVPVCSFTFGIPSEEMISRLKQNNIIVIGTATTVREAIEIEKAGMDMTVVQGSEAGGHRGNFLNEAQESLIGLMSLIPQVVDHVNIPVIAAGGIMDGRGVVASICLGAQAVQMGTAFLTCIESGAHKVYKEAILQAEEDQTVLTRAFSGKWARGIKNEFIKEMQKFEVSVPEFPVQNTLTQSIRKAAASQSNREYMSLWSGQSPRLAKIQTVEALFKKIMVELKK